MNEAMARVAAAEGLAEERAKEGVAKEREWRGRLADAEVELSEGAEREAGLTALLE